MNQNLVANKKDQQDHNHSSNEEEEGQQQIFFRLIKKVGAMGRYQIALIITLCTASVYMGAVLLITPFLFYQNQYNCQSFQTTKSQCYDIICELPLQQRKIYIPDDPYIKSFSNKFGDYRCPSQTSSTDLIITLFYSGQLVGFLFVSLVGDFLRSKVLMVGGLIIAVTGCCILSFSDILELSVAGMWLMTFGLTGPWNLGFIFITQMVQEKQRSKYKILICASFSLGALLVVLWFFLIPNFKWVVLYFYAIPLLILAIIFIIFFQDTPISMITKNTPEKACKQLLKIAKINGIKDVDLTVQDIIDTQNQYRRKIASRSTINQKIKKFTILDLFRYKSLRKLTLILLVVDSVFYLQYLAPTLMLDQFDFNIYINGAAVQTAQILAAVFGYIAVTRMKRRVSGMGSFALIAIYAVVLIFVWDQDSKDIDDIWSNLTVLIFIFLIQLTVTNAFNTYAVYLNELYPTQIRIIAIGFVKMFGAVTTMLSQLIVNACLNSGFKIMILFAILGAISVFLYYLLPQTFGQRPPEVIQELDKGTQFSRSGREDYRKVEDLK